MWGGLAYIAIVVATDVVDASVALQHRFHRHRGRGLQCQQQHHNTNTIANVFPQQSHHNLTTTTTPPRQKG
jgi:hypothetical protein